jgi:hypothetical protein
VHHPSQRDLGAAYPTRFGYCPDFVDSPSVVFLELCVEGRQERIRFDPIGLHVPVPRQLGRISPITAAALVFAALFSVLIFSVVALSMLREGDSALPTSLGETRQFEPATALVPSHRPSA